MKMLLLSVVLGLCYGGVGVFVQWPAKVSFHAALMDALAVAGVTAKEVCDQLGYTQSQWAKIARGEPGHNLPALNRLEQLSPRVWDALLPRLAYCVSTRRQQQDVTQPLERTA